MSKPDVDDAPTVIASLGPIVILPIGVVQPAPDNPRKISAQAVDAVAKSLRAFGWQQPIVVDTAGQIIVGHTRHRAAVALGLTEVPVTVAEGLTTPEQVRAYRIADNRTHDYSTWDFPVLALQLDGLPEFADVLGLADWEGIVGSFDDGQVRPDAGEDAGDPDGALAIYAGEAFSFIVVCDSKETARTVALAVVDLPGVLDVRDRRT